MAPVLINVVAARSETGKTTLIERMLPELTARGLRVAAVKGHLHHYDLDLPGKDTWRFAQAGAALTGMATADQFIVIGYAGEEGGLAAALHALRDCDLVLIEGDKRTRNPRIEVVRAAMGRELLSRENLLAVATDVPGLDAGPEVPVFGLEEYREIANLIYEKFFGSSRSSDARGERSEQSLTHFDDAGRPRMVDVSEKQPTQREAYARGEIVMAPQTLAAVQAGRMAKGDVLGVAQVAAIMAVKETGRLIPMCHPLNISGVEVEFTPVEAESKIEIGVRVKLTGRTGVEMEALTGVSVAALTIYDMCKAVDKTMVIQNIRLEEKKGGRSGHFRREQK